MATMISSPKEVSYEEDVKENLLSSDSILYAYRHDTSIRKCCGKRDRRKSFGDGKL